MDEKNRKFTYEDAVDYILNKMNEETKNIFEEELKFNEELKKLYELALSKKDLLEKIDKYEISENIKDIEFKKMHNILNSETTNPQPGQIWQLDIQDFSRKDKLLFKDLYALILNETEIEKFIDFRSKTTDFELYNQSGNIYYFNDIKLPFSNSKLLSFDTEAPQLTKIFKSYRILLLSKNIDYALYHDLIFSEPLISFTEKNVVAHMHIVGNVLRRHLQYFIGEMNTRIFNSLKKADLKDYSNIDKTNIVRGRNKLEIGEEELEEIEIWTDLVRDKINQLTFETLEELENLYRKEKDRKTKPQSIFYSIKKPELIEKFYEIDENNTLIIRKDRKDILKILPDFEFEDFKLQLTKTKKISQKEFNNLIYKTVEQNQIEKKFDTKVEDFAPIESGMFRGINYAAKDVSRETPHTIEIFSNEEISVSFLFYLRENRYEDLVLELIFFKEKNLKKIDHLLFAIPEKKVALITENINVVENTAIIPLTIEPEKIISNKNSYNLEIIYQKIHIVLKIRLIFQ